jgi:hypothetical protein
MAVKADPTNLKALAAIGVAYCPRPPGALERP